MGLIPAGAGRTASGAVRRQGPRVHPRWRGADALLFSMTRARAGSSPLARGRTTGSTTHARPRRFIPAGAGRTHRTHRGRRPRGAHPRWRGADKLRSPRGMHGWGSSPLARGGQGVPVRDLRRPGLIPAGAGWTLGVWRGRQRRCAHPAGAGRTRATPPEPVWRGAHPRWRGADLNARSPPAPATGSSPLARGELARRGDPDEQRGLIPLARGGLRKLLEAKDCFGLILAGAGRTPRTQSSFRRSQGSSPLARGGRRPDRGAGPVGGLIPAGAGRTRCSGASGRRAGAHPRWRGADRGGGEGVDAVGAHPRWRGADILGLHPATEPEGSSPLARGGPDRATRPGRPPGLIPAGAGRTRTRARWSRRRGAHPRWRGADLVRVGDVLAGLGSSPLARGGPLDDRGVDHLQGLIPAGAGRTRS